MSVTSGSPALDSTALNGKEFADLTFIRHFLDGKLIGVVIENLNAATEKLDLEEYLAETAQENNLPKDGWKIGKEDHADLTYQSFKVSLTAGEQPGMSVMIFDTAGEKEKEKREL